MKKTIGSVDLGKILPLGISILAMAISVYGFFYNRDRDLGFDRLEMATDYIEQNYEVNASLQVLRCMTDVLGVAESEKKLLYVFTPDEEKETVQSMLLSSRDEIAEMRGSLLTTRHYYKIKINNRLIELAKSSPKDKFDLAKYVCQNHIG